MCNLLNDRLFWLLTGTALVLCLPAAAQDNCIVGAGCEGDIAVTLPAGAILAIIFFYMFKAIFG